MNKNLRAFISGMAEGFDLLAAEAVLKLRMKKPDVILISVIPFMGQELDYTPRDKERYKIIYDLANKIIFTSDTYHDKAFFKRNDYLLDNSSLVICYYNGLRGGTMYTYNRAVRQNIEIINLYKDKHTLQP